MQGGLSATLRKLRAEALIQQAETIRGYQHAPERIDEAEKHVREAMLQRTLGHLTAEEESRIFSILNFAMPTDAANQGDHAPFLYDLGQ